MINPAWFALDKSRGIEEPLLKVYMRATVVVSEYLIYIPAMVIFLRRYARDNQIHPWNASIALLAVLMQPATILIDHGHFQYNVVMLGFGVATLECLLAGRALWASIFFVAALGYKQMALYYAPAIFAYMLGICLSSRFRPGRLAAIAVVTSASFALLFAPFLVSVLRDSYRGGSQAPTPRPPLLDSFPIFRIEDSSPVYPYAAQLAQAIHRIFPFARGLFEDKVANMWCALHTFYKLNRFPTTFLKRASLAATLVSILVPCTVIGRYPRPHLLPLALASTAWGFFLCSFQVHEKSVLLPLLPMTLLLGAAGGLGKEIRSWVGLANMLGVWTLFPLLKRDELRVPYFVLTLLWAYLLGLPPTSLSLYRKRSDLDPATTSSKSADLPIVTKLLHLSYYFVMVIWHFLEAFVDTPPGKPDLWVVLNVLIGTSGFGLTYLWCTAKLVQQALPRNLLKTQKQQDIAPLKKKQ